MGKKGKKKDDSKRRKAEKARRKEEMKANETPAEKKARRLEKKRKKEESRNKQKQLFGYTNENNPFGDANLTKAFNWRRKTEKEKAEGKITREMTAKETKEHQRMTRLEVEKVKERRKQREIEKEQQEEMREQIERDAMMEEAAGWEEKEEEFHRGQAKLRSEIRIQEGREKAIDILAKNLNLFNATSAPDANIAVDLDVELTEPHKIFEGLSIRDLEDLKADIKVHLTLEDDQEYWNALDAVCEDELRQLKGMGGDPTQQAIRADINNMLKHKSRKELKVLETEIQSKLSGRSDEVLDLPYWENLLSHMSIHKARAFLRHFHKQLLKKRLAQIKKQHFEELKEGGGQETKQDSDDEALWEPELIPHSEAGTAPGDVPVAMPSDSDEDFEPTLLTEAEAEGAVDPEQDKLELEAHRRVVLEKQEQEQQMMMETVRSKEEDQDNADMREAAGMNRFMMSAEDMYAREANKPMAADEVVFKDETDTGPSRTYWWHDKYRPRRPRYFNRVKTGYEWNKYNQTHYDKENPPPKIVQGYKFNVFYPDLIDSSTPPSYYVEKDKEDADYSLIRFTAGPPYEDIAFKIVNKEWEYNHRRGFRCVFDRGVLLLYFNFRRYRYRR